MIGPRIASALALALALVAAVPCAGASPIGRPLAAAQEPREAVSPRMRIGLWHILGSHLLHRSVPLQGRD